MKETTKQKTKNRHRKAGETHVGFTIDKNMDPHMLDDHPYFKAKHERAVAFLKTCSLKGLPEDLKTQLEELQRRLNAADKK